jgi:peptidoglycan/LPS O-acetylase OafA/YrhL
VAVEDKLTIYQSALLGLFFFPVCLGSDMFGILNSKYMKALGDISFSIYLMHGLVLYVVFTFLFPLVINTIDFFLYLTLMPIVAVIVVFISYLTYVYIEKVFMDICSRVVISKHKISMSIE